MSVQLSDIAFGRVCAPDLYVMEAFLTDFGMHVSDRTNDALYMRGSGSSHHLHVVHRGSAGVRALAFEAASSDDLLRAAQLPGASAVVALDEPAGGRCVRLKEPNGLCIEVVYGRSRVLELPMKLHAMNNGKNPRVRLGGMTDMSPRPAQVMRIGHGVLFTPHVKETARWFEDTFGMLKSDVVYEGSRDNVLGIFLRLNHGERHVDHHVVFIAYASSPGLHHLSFEVADIDDLLAGKEFLATRAYDHLWGISRHVQGGQVSDYWVDPAGVMMEHWTDTDRIDAREPLRFLTREQSRSFWGPPATPEFRAHRLTPFACEPSIEGGA